MRGFIFSGNSNNRCLSGSGLEHIGFFRTGKKILEIKSCMSYLYYGPYGSKEQQTTTGYCLEGNAGVGP